ncbi:MAG: nitroreductase family protein [Acidimicrobiales bacterium]
MAIDVTSVDEALATTRAVRRRLDLSRPVDHQLILDCIDIAEQAPSGGNQGSRRWVVVRDPAIKAGLAQLYLDAAGRWMIEARDALAGTGHPQERVMASAAHLAEHLAEVPVIVIPTILGVHDGSRRPGLFDSVIQSVWSFCVALRARGLGTAWTTAVLQQRRALAELLDLPEDLTPIALIPVAWTKGTDFKRAPRHPARAITYVDRFAQTWERGPGDPPTLADGPGTVAELDVRAPIATVWHHVVAHAERAADGAPVTREEPGRRVGWVTGEPADPAERWWFELEPIAGAVRLRHRLVLGAGASGLAAAVAGAAAPQRHATIAAHLAGQHAALHAAVQAIRVAAEDDAAGTRP